MSFGSRVAVVALCGLAGVRGDLFGPEQFARFGIGNPDFRASGPLVPSRGRPAAHESSYCRGASRSGTPRSGSWLSVDV